MRWDAKNGNDLDDAEAVAMLERPYRAPWDKELKWLDCEMTNDEAKHE